MKIVKDGQNREWELALTIGVMMAIKENLGADLLKIEQVADDETTLFAKLTDDDIYVAEIISYACSESRLQERGMTRQDFVKALDGKTLYAAKKAFFEELAVFFEDTGNRFRAKMVRNWEAIVEETKKLFESNVDSLSSKDALEKFAKNLETQLKESTSGK